MVLYFWHGAACPPKSNTLANHEMSQNTIPIAISLAAYDSVLWHAAVHLRRGILRTPLGLDFSGEELARESADTHFVAISSGKLIGTVVLTPLEADTVKLRQMAVAQDLRGHGVGEALLRAFEAYARAIGTHTITLAARETARRFYERNGYTAEGEGFIEVTIPHIKMVKAL
jgi:predicted GNAT family N-acyltransferase